MFGDIDCLPDPRNPLKEIVPWEQAVDNVTRAAEFFSLVFRIYRTAAGMRLIEMTRTHEPNDPETGDVLKMLGCDKAFTALVGRLHNFRVRLTAKPWRLPANEQPKFESEADIDRHLEAATYSVAHFLGEVGGYCEPPTEVAAVVALHDDYCRVLEGLPLA